MSLGHFIVVESKAVCLTVMSVGISATLKENLVA